MEFGQIRAMDEDTVLSPSLPRLGIRINPVYIYVGDLQFITNETFHVEEFIFLNPNGLGHVTSLLIIHFAGYLENKEGAYHCPVEQPVHLDGDEYQYDVCSININEYLEQISGSELSHAVDYVHQRAYTLAGDMVYHRFTRLVSADHRHEFIIAYLESCEDASPVTGDDSAAQQALERALSNFAIVH